MLAAAMCEFISLIVADADQGAIETIMKRHDRRAAPYENASLRKALLPGERSYVTTNGHCDCGTVLGAKPDDLEARMRRERRHLERLGWSAAKIARAIEDKRRAAQKSGRPGIDSIELWAAIARDLLDHRPIGQIGFFVHTYRHDVETEEMKVSRHAPRKEETMEEALAAMPKDEIRFLSRADQKV